jgi:hypothetical protein
VDSRGATISRLEAEPDAERRLRSAIVVGCARRWTVSELRDPSRANNGVTSVGVRASTPRKTRSISDRGLA